MLMLCLGIVFGMPKTASANAATTTETTETNEAEVGGGNKYPTLAEAVEKATAGDTVTLLKDVELTETLTIDKSLIFELNNHTVTLNGGYILINDADGAVDADVTIRNGTVNQTVKELAGGGNEPAIKFSSVGNVVLKGVTVTSVSNCGIYFGGTVGNITMEDCTCTVARKGTVESVLVKGTNSKNEEVWSEQIYGIHFDALTNTITITNCKSTISYANDSGETVDSTKKITRNLYGLYFGDCQGNVTIQNTDEETTEDNATITAVGGTGNCIFFSGCKGTNTIKNLVIGKSYNGICISNVAGSTEITNCKFKGADCAIFNYANNITSVIIDNCTINGATYGIYDQSSGTTIVRNSTIKNYGSYGIYLKKKKDAELKGADFIVENTNILANEKLSLTPEEITALKSGYYAIGNYGRGLNENNESLTGALTVKDCVLTAKTFGIFGNGGKSNWGTNITVENTDIYTDFGIYHPQFGKLTINGGSIYANSNGIEIRAGELILNDYVSIIVTAKTPYTVIPSGGGGTVTGAAVAVSPHTTNQEIKVTINSAHLKVSEEPIKNSEGEDTYQKAFTQVETRTPPYDDDTSTPAEITLSIIDGTFDGKIYSENEEHFISGGVFDIKPDDKYVVETSKVIRDEKGLYDVISDVEQAKRDACDYVRLYAAVKKVAYTSEMEAIIRSDEVYTLVGVYNAKMQAVAEVDKAYEAITKEKKDAIAEIKDAAKEYTDEATGEVFAKVVVPTATLSAINEAMDSDQIREFKNNAIAEIKDIRSFRKQINGLTENGGEVLGEITAFRNALLGTEDSTGALAAAEQTLKTYLDTVKGNINKYTSDELGNTQKALDEAIAGARNELNDAIAALKGDMIKKLAPLDSLVDTLTGELGKVNSGLHGDIGALDEKISKLGNVSGENLSEELVQLKESVDALSAKVSEAVNVEQEKAKAAEKIHRILNDLTADLTAGSENESMAYSENELTEAQREKLRSVYSGKMADLVEQYYREAVASVANATTAEEAKASADNFKRNVDTAKIMDIGPRESGIPPLVYTLLIVGISLTAIALLLTIILLAKRKQTVVVTDGAHVLADGEYDPFAFHKENHKSFGTRLQEAPEQTLALYSAIKNEFLSYSQVKSRICNQFESFHQGHKALAELKVSGKAIYLYLALDPAGYDVEKYHFDNKSDVKAYAHVPMMVKITGTRTLMRAKTLIADCLQDAEKDEQFVETDYAEEVKRQKDDPQQ